MEFQFGKNLKSGLFWIGLFKGTGQLFIWLNTILVARFLDPTDYGLVGMVALITEFILLIGNFGFGTSILQKKELQEIHVNSLFWILTGIGMFILIALYFIAPGVAIFFNNANLIPIVRLSAIALFFNIITDVPEKLLLKKLQYKKTGLVDFTSNLLASLTVLFLAMNRFGAYSLVFGNILTGFLKFSLACIVGQWFPKVAFQWRGLKTFFKFGGTLIISRVLWYLYSNADYMVLAKRFGQVIFGFYSFAFNFSCIPINKLQPIIGPVLFSSFSVIQDDLPEVRHQFLRIVNIMFTCYAMIYCGLFWVSAEFVKIFLGVKWEPLTLVLQVLLIVQPLRAISTLFPNVIDALGQPGVSAKNAVIFTILMVPSFFIGSFWGMVGVAVVWCIVYPLAFLIIAANNLRVIQITMKTYLAQLWPGTRMILLVSLVLYLVKLFVHAIPFSSEPLSIWVSFVGTIFTGTLVNLGLLWTFDKNFLRTAIGLLKRDK